MFLPSPLRPYRSWMRRLARREVERAVEAAKRDLAAKLMAAHAADATFKPRYVMPRRFRNRV